MNPNTTQHETGGATPHKNVQAAKLAVMREVGYVQKQRSQGLNYTYAGEAALIEAIRPAMIEAGLTLSPFFVEILSESSYQTRNGTEMRLIRTRSTYRLDHAESDTHENITVLGEAQDSGDKCCPKAMTLAYKYALRQTFIIETGDDPDKYPSEQEPPKGKNPAPEGQGGPKVYKTDPKKALPPKEEDISQEGLPEPLAEPGNHKLETGNQKGKELRELDPAELKRWLTTPVILKKLSLADKANAMAYVMLRDRIDAATVPLADDEIPEPGSYDE